jgi:cytochrome c-type biogenesis protein CcmH/NrfG
MHFGRRTISVLALAVVLAAIPAFAQKAAEPANAKFDRLSKGATDARMQNRTEEAIGLYRQALDLRATWAEGWWFLGELL